MVSSFRLSLSFLLFSVSCLSTAGTRTCWLFDVFALIPSRGRKKMEKIRHVRQEINCFLPPPCVQFLSNLMVTALNLKYLLKSARLETETVSGFDRGCGMQMCDKRLFPVSVLELIFTTELIRPCDGLYIAQVFGWCFGVLLCFVW